MLLHLSIHPVVFVVEHGLNLLPVGICDSDWNLQLGGGLLQNIVNMGVDDVKLTVDNADGIVQDSLNRIILTDSRLQLKGALIQVVVAFQCSHSTALNQKYGLQVHPRHAEPPPPVRCRLQYHQSQFFLLCSCFSWSIAIVVYLWEPRCRGFGLHMECVIYTQRCATFQPSSSSFLSQPDPRDEPPPPHDLDIAVAASLLSANSSMTTKAIASIIAISLIF